MASSFWELLLVMVVVFVLFGAGKLPRVMGELGQGIKALRENLKDGDKTPTNQEEK